MDNYLSPQTDASVEKEAAKNELDQLAMQSLAAGRDGALDEIMDRWQKPIVRFLYQTVGDYETSLDLAQQVFVQIYRYRNRYRSGKKFSSYIFTIAANLAKNHFRWKGRHPETSLAGELDSQASPDSGPVEMLEQDERGIEVRKAVLELPEKLRIPVILFYFENLSHAEIAEIIKASTKTVETRLYRARHLLKEIL